MNILIADSRISTAALLAAELRSRDVSVTLAVPSKEGGAKPAAAQEKAFGSPLREISWNPFSWLSSDSLVFEAANPSGLDALVLLFDLNALAPFFAELSPEEIFLSSAVAFQTLAASALKRFQAKKSGRIVFMLSRKESRSSFFDLKGMQYIAASSAEAAFERFAEETAFVFSQAESGMLDAVLIKSEFDSEGFLSWAADHIAGEGAKTAKAAGKWISRGGGGLSSIFQRRT